jgi:anti-sigma regulatory factor (Ser/Thr protein kinase)
MTADRSGPRGAHARPGEAGAGRNLQYTLLTGDQAAGLARRTTREVLVAWRLAHLEETAALLVSELVTNAVRHARDTDAIVLILRTAGTCLRIEVQDGDACWPQPRTPTRFDESGFGFALVEALADKWGVRETGTGKAVWVELDIRQEACPCARAG